MAAGVWTDGERCELLCTPLAINFPGNSPLYRAARSLTHTHVVFAMALRSIVNCDTKFCLWISRQCALFLAKIDAPVAVEYLLQKLMIVFLFPETHDRTFANVDFYDAELLSFQKCFSMYAPFLHNKTAMYVEYPQVIK
jgi:hypothetical protein